MWLAKVETDFHLPLEHDPWLGPEKARGVIEDPGSKIEDTRCVLPVVKSRD